jgi:hypothetical protein
MAKFWSSGDESFGWDFENFGLRVREEGVKT